MKRPRITTEEQGQLHLRNKSSVVQNKINVVQNNSSSIRYNSSNHLKMADEVATFKLTLKVFVLWISEG